MREVVPLVTRSWWWKTTMFQVGWLLALALAFPGSEREYRVLPFDGNLATMLKNHLQQAKGMEGLQELLDDIRKNPGKYKAWTNQKNLGKNAGGVLDRDTRQMLEKLLENNRDRIDSDQLKAMKQALAKQQDDADAGIKPDFDLPEMRKPGAAEDGPRLEANKDDEVKLDQLAKKHEVVVRSIREVDWCSLGLYANLSTQPFQA